MHDDCELVTIVDSIIYHTLDIWDEVKLISKYKHGRHETDWQTFTVGEQAEIQCRLALAWMRLGMLPGERVAIMAVNRPRWIFTLNGLLTAHLTAVPIYPTLTAEQAAYILEDSGSKYVVVDTLAQGEKILSVMGRLPQLKGIYIMDRLERRPDPPLHPFDALLESVPEPIDARRLYVRARMGAPETGDEASCAEEGSELLCRRIRGIQGEDVAVIVYTSGTTGKPKGVMLTHQNFLGQRPVQKGFNVSPDDVFLNHLPFSHCFGLTADLFGSSFVPKPPAKRMKINAPLATLWVREASSKYMRPVTSLPKKIPMARAIRIKGTFNLREMRAKNTTNIRIIAVVASIYSS